MKRLLETLKSARWLEAALLVALLCILIVCAVDLPQSKAQGSETERRMERILSSIDGAGRVHVMINETEEGISGIVAACPGADDLRVALTMRSAIATLTGIDNSRIEIIRSGE